MHYAKMNDDEDIAEEYLKRQGFQSVDYEPDGNIPPDFLVNNHIAVEARRLNYNRHTPDGVEGTEQNIISLEKCLEKISKSYGSPEDGKTWLVSPDCIEKSPPILRNRKDWKWLEENVRETFDEFLHNNLDNDKEMLCGLRFSFHLVSTCTRKFIMSPLSASDEGSFIPFELLKNISICIKEKSKKVKRYVQRYDEWWLLLIDHTKESGMLGRSSHEVLLKNIQWEEPWSKIIAVSLVAEQCLLFELQNHNSID